MKIWDGSILRIDLTDGSHSTEDVRGYRKYLGGRAINQYILLREAPRRTSPFDPSNLIVIGAGLLSGADAPGACRLNVDSRNALTEGIGSGNAGGFFASEMKRGGVAHIVLSGRCPELSYLYIEDGVPQILPAKAIRGAGTTETMRHLAERHGHAKVLSVGPAGENLCRSACIVVDGARAVGRCGLGAVMGSKNLKAVAVKGTGSVEVADPEAFSKLVRHLNDKLTSNPFNRERMKYGVYCYPPWETESPYRNFSGLVPPESSRSSLLPDRFLAYKIGEKGCHACPIKCWGVYEMEEEGRKIRVEALQGNDPHDFGAKLDLPDPKNVLKAHGLCTELGLDVDNASGAIAWAIDCFQKGLLTEKETAGLKLEWGDAHTVFALLDDMAHRRGFGDLLAEGSLRASRKLGRDTERQSIHVKGQDLFECLWMSPSWALGTVVSPRGGGHTRGAALEGRLQNIDEQTARRYFGIPRIGGPTDYENKERLVYFFERLGGFLDCAGICVFTNSLRLDMMVPEDYATLLSVATGEEFTLEDILRIGERAHNLEKVYNLLNTDWGRREDMPPARFVEVPLDGRCRIDLQAWDRMLDRYYQLHGWDSEGRPTKEGLCKLGMDEISDMLGTSGQ